MFWFKKTNKQHKTQKLIFTKPGIQVSTLACFLIFYMTLGNLYNTTSLFLLLTYEANNPLPVSQSNGHQFHQVNIHWTFTLCLAPC